MTLIPVIPLIIIKRIKTIPTLKPERNLNIIKIKVVRIFKGKEKVKVIMRVIGSLIIITRTARTIVITNLKIIIIRIIRIDLVAEGRDCLGIKRGRRIDESLIES